MEIEKIEHNGLIVAIIIKGNEWPEGLNFISSDTDYQQVGFWNYNKGKVLSAHVHLDAPRQVLKTQEVILVKQGRLRVDIYNQEEQFFTSAELGVGDIGVFLHGGHGYEILENGTKVVEIKNGPYVGPDKDRKRI